jgi:hypothetical protein
MSWDDVIIGEGSKLNTAIAVFSIKGDHGISENQVSYWISGCILGIGMTIFKDTDVGQDLSKLIADEVDTSDILKWLDIIALEHISAEVLLKKIENYGLDMFAKGEESKMLNIRRTLGIYQP